MLEHCPDQFLPKTQPQLDINLQKRKKLFSTNTERTPEKDGAVKERRIWEER